MPLATDLPPTADVVVIGGGILGVATCYWLAKRGIRVALLQQEQIASGASGRNGGFVTSGTAESYLAAVRRLGVETVRTIFKLTMHNRALIRQVLAEEQIDCDYREPGSIHLALNMQEWKLLLQETEMLRADSVPIAKMTMLTREQLGEWIKTPLAAEIVGGRLTADDGLWHPARFIGGLMQAAQRCGARAYQAKVVELIPRQGDTLIRTTRGTLAANAVVVAANAWLGTLLPAFRDAVVPARGQMLTYKPIEPIFSTGVGGRSHPRASTGSSGQMGAFCWEDAVPRPLGVTATSWRVCPRQRCSRPWSGFCRASFHR